MEGAMGSVVFRGKEMAVKTSLTIDYSIEHERKILELIGAARCTTHHFVQLIDDDDDDDDASSSELKMKRIDPDYMSYDDFKESKRWNAGVEQQLILAVAGLHECIGVVHNDLHSSNIFVKSTNVNVHAYLFDDDECYVVPTHGYYPIIIDYGLAVDRSQKDMLGPFYYVGEGKFPFDANPVDDAIYLCDHLTESIRKTDRNVMDRLMKCKRLNSLDCDKALRSLLLFPDFVSELYYIIFDSIVTDGRKLEFDDCIDIICIMLNKLSLPAATSATVGCTCSVTGKLQGAFYEFIRNLGFTPESKVDEILDRLKSVRIDADDYALTVFNLLQKFIDVRVPSLIEMKRKRYDDILSSDSRAMTIVRRLFDERLSRRWTIRKAKTLRIIDYRSTGTTVDSCDTVVDVDDGLVDALDSAAKNKRELYNIIIKLL